MGAVRAQRQGESVAIAGEGEAGLVINAGIVVRCPCVEERPAIFHLGVFRAGGYDWETPRVLFSHGNSFWW